MWGKDFINSFCMSFYCLTQNEFLPKKKLLFIQYSTLNMICNTSVFWNFSIAWFFHICLNLNHSWFQTFAVFWMLCVFFWVILRRLNSNAGELPRRKHTTFLKHFTAPPSLNPPGNKALTYSTRCQAVN
jgi:hypothetical protein